MDRHGMARRSPAALLPLAEHRERKAVAAAARARLVRGAGRAAPRLTAKSVLRRVAGSAVALALLSLLTTGALAQGGPPPPDATPGAVGTDALTLAAIDPAVAPGHRLAVVELTWAPGAYATRHSHPTALVTCVKQGALGFLLHEGAATLTRGATAATPEAAEQLAPNAEVVLGPRDCIAFDEFASHMEHTGWNAGDGPLVLWEARLLKVGEPFTTYVDERGTPVA